MSNLSYEDIKSLTDWNKEETRHFMPNEIFEELQTNLPKYAPIKTKKSVKESTYHSPHITFTYSYYYLISWLYRYAKYGSENINTKVIKQLLGYSEFNKTINYIIKNKGALDLMGYTKTTKNYPVAWELDLDKDPLFMLIDDLSVEMKQYIQEGKGKNYKVKYPVRHFHRDEEDTEDELTGIFYDLSNTHEVGFDVFIHCMSIKELGTNGFYLYGYLKMRNQQFDGGYDVSLIDLSEETGIPYVSMNRYLDALRKYNLVHGIHNQEYFAKGIDDKDRKANTYIANESYQFTFVPQPYQKMEVKTRDEHLSIKAKKEEEQKKESKKVDIELSELPY